MWDAMLGKGFKASRCKTLLKLAMARIKLLRNKRDIQIKQLRKDIAQLLTTGQEPSARIRVEHIIREQNILAAYDILELFCELVAVRLPIIESQKNCPLDLKEAISSLIFASPRCSDLPELLQIRQLFAAKYGKEFAAAAAELRPDCGVNRRIIEKLSVRAPPGDVKLKLMKEIATEHDVDWDATESEAELLKTHEDLLDGPNHFIGAHEMPLTTPAKSELPADMSAKDARPPSTSEIHMSPLQVGISSPDYVSEEDEREFAPSQIPHPSAGPEVHLPSVPVSKVLPLNNVRNDDDLAKYGINSAANPDTNKEAQARREQNNTGYVDVASAAKAAADSADRAVAAARAAAELARKHKDHGSREAKEMERQNSSNSSDTDLGSDDEHGGNLPVINREASQSRNQGKAKPEPAFDSDNSDSDVEEYDVPRGRGAGGTKPKGQTAYKHNVAQGSQEEPKFRLKGAKLDFDTATERGKPLFDDIAKEEDGLAYSGFRKQERENRSASGDSTPSGRGGGLRWISKEDTERYDIFDINREGPTVRYSAFDSMDNPIGKSPMDGGHEEENTGSGDIYSSFDQPFYAGDSAKFNLGHSRSRERESSPLFDEEGSVGRSSREPSRLGSLPPTSGYDNQYDASPFSSASKASVLFSTESSKKVDEDDLTARFEALKMRR